MIRICAALLVLVACTFIPTKQAEAATRCVHLIRQGNSETLVNKCNVCMVTSIFRSRPGNEVPVNRDYYVQARSTFPVPLRGPSRSRIKVEKPCPGEEGSQPDLPKSLQQTSAQAKCVSMERSGIGLVLINRCGQCRAVAIERVSADGSKHNRDYMLVAGKASIPVNSDGYAQAGLLGEIACPAN